MDLHPKQLGSAILYPQNAMILAHKGKARYGTNIDTLVKRTVQHRIYCKVIGPILTISIAHVSRVTNDDETPV
jgi:ribosomal protein L14